MNSKHLALVASLALVPSAFAIHGKTLYHYIASEAMFWDKSLPVTAANYPKLFLDRYGLAQQPFDTLVFAPSLGFGSVAGLIPSSTVPTHQPQANSAWMKNWKNAMPELSKAGIDPIAETVKWCRANKKEAVVALPVNLLNSHCRERPSAKRPRNSWYCYLLSEFQVRNPDALISPDGKNSTPCGNGVCVDYGQAKVRDKFSTVASEIAGKYDIDAIMIDFTMVPTLFRSVAEGGTAQPKEVEAITAMMLKIKNACKAASGRLGHPVAFAARVPDSIGYCKDIGIDLQGWFDQKMLDFVVLGGYFQLNRWNVVGDLAKKAGMPYYVSFTQSGITVFNDSGYSGDDERISRNSKEACRARIADAFLCKAAGCMFTMGQDWEVKFPYNITVPYDEKANRTGAKRYFVSYTNDRFANQTLKEGTKHLGLPSLVSNNPVSLSKGIAKYTLSIWEDFDGFKRDGINYRTVLVTEATIPSGMETIVTFNSKEIKPYKKRAGTQLYELPPGVVKHGANEITVKAKGKNKRGGIATLGNIALEVTFPKKEASK